MSKLSELISCIMDLHLSIENVSFIFHILYIILFMSIYNITICGIGCLCCINALYLCSICVFIYNYLVYLDTYIDADIIGIDMSSDSIGFVLPALKVYFFSFGDKSQI